MPILPTIPTLAGLSYPIKQLLGFAAKNSMQAQAKSEKEILQDLATGDNPSFYSEQTRDGGNEIDTYLYGVPYNTENTSNVGPSYENYLSANFPLRKHAVKTYDTHFGDTLYIDQKYKDQVLDELEQGKTVGASMGRYGHAPSYIVNTKDDKRRPYDAGGHLMQFQYDKDGNVVANMSDIYDFLPRDFEEKYGAIKEYGLLKTAGMYAMHHAGTPFIVRQNGIPVRFKEITPGYKTELQSKLGNFLSNWGDMYDLTIPHRLTDEQIEEIFNGKQSGDEVLDFMDQKGYLTSVFKKGGRIHIKKKNRGKFTEYCGGKVTQECIAKGKKSKDPKIRKRATFAANARKWKHENGGILKAQNGVNMYPIYGSQQKAKLAYDAGSRNPEAIGALFDDYRPSQIIGKSYSHTSRTNDVENDNFQSYFKTTGNNNLGIEQKIGRVNGNEIDVTTFLLPNGDTYSENHINETSQYNVDYAKRLGLNKLPKPKSLVNSNENGGILKALDYANYITKKPAY